MKIYDFDEKFYDYARTWLALHPGLNEQQVEEHLRGERTVGTYIQRPNSTVRYIVWDIDISKQFILKYGSSGVEFEACLKNAYRKALEIQKLLEEKGMRSAVIEAMKACTERSRSLGK